MTISSLDEAHATILRLSDSRIQTHSPAVISQMQACLKALGNPERQLRVIHIAGTSGKTSTAYYISALLTAAGVRAGTAVSPYMYTMNERLQVGGQPLVAAVFCRALDEFLDLWTQIKGIELTYIQMLIAFTFWQLKRLHVEYAVIETSSGGRYDPTNVAQRHDKVAVITDIGLDHADILGTTLSEIAYQKAGIMHAGNRAFMLPQPDEVTNVVGGQARLRQANLMVLDAKPPQPVHVQLTPLPLFQQRNWWLARQVYKHLAQHDGLLELSPEQLVQTMHTRVPGRMDHVVCKGVDLILDVAHNPQKMNMLVESLRYLYPHKAVAAMILIGSGKDSRSMLEQLRLLHPSLICSAYNYIEGLRHQAHPASVLAKEAHEIGFDRITTEANLGRALALLLKGPEPVKLITGSVYGISQVKQLIDDLNRAVSRTPKGLP